MGARSFYLTQNPTKVIYFEKAIVVDRMPAEADPVLAVPIANCVWGYT
jgi:hypothetical protein